MTDLEKRITEIKDRIKSASEVSNKVFLDYVGKEDLGYHYFNDTKFLLDQLQRYQKALKDCKERLTYMYDVTDCDSEFKKNVFEDLNQILNAEVQDEQS